MNPDIAWVDGVMLGVLALSMIVGALRGLMLELLALVGWVVAYFAADALTPWLAPHLPVGAPGSALNHGVAFASAFLATLIVWGLLSRLVRTLVHATPLRAFDRGMGAVFGLLRGAVVLMVVALLVPHTPAARSPAWQASVGAKWLVEATLVLRPLVPKDLSHLLRT